MNPVIHIHPEGPADRRIARLGANATLRAAVPLVALALMLAMGMALFTNPAVASRGRVFTGSFGGASSTTADPYPLWVYEKGTAPEANNLAVDTTTGRPSSGDVYVTDPHNHRVEKFDANGNFILMFGKNVNKTRVEAGGSAEAERNVCTAISGDECQQGTSGTSPGAFVGSSIAIAVDGSSGPSAGDVYVSDTTKNPAAGEGEAAGEGIVAKFDEGGKIVSSWGVGGQMQASGRPFGALGGVAVDPDGNLLVYGAYELVASGNVPFQSRPLVFELTQDGSLLTSWQSPSKPFGSGIAVDTEHHVYLREQGGSIYKYNESNGNLLGHFAEGEYLTSDLVSHTIDVETSHLGFSVFEATCPGSPFAPGCPQVEVFGRSRPHNWGPLAVNYNDPSDPIYVSEQAREVAVEAIATVPDVTTLPAASVSTSAATLKGTVDPEGVAITACFFEWGEGEGAYEHSAPCEGPSAEGIGTGSASVPVHAQIPVQAGKAYHFRLVAANAQDVNEPVEGADVILGPPRVDSTSVSEVTATSVTLHAELNPRNLDTKYHLEYLTEAEFNENGESFSGLRPATSVPLADGEAGSGGQDVIVSQHVAGLLLHTAYRYRVIARNTLGEGAVAAVGPAETFVTWGTGEFGLPDGRQWEMVSPPDKHGALVEPIGEDWLIQAAAGGGRMAYATRAPSESNPAGYTIIQSSLATRGAGGGWSSRDLALPHISATGVSVGQGWEYRFFSEDLEQAIVQPFGAFVPCKSDQGVAQPCLSAEASEQTAFLASDYAAGAPSEPCTSSCYTPLVTGAEGFANVPPETVFGQKSIFGHTCPPAIECGPRFLDATPDASHALLEAPTALGASPAAEATVPPNSIYEWSGESAPSDQLHLISVLPGNTSKEALPATEAEVGSGGGSVRHSISEDGSRVVFNTTFNTGGHGQHVYLRENANQPQSPIGAQGECLTAADACTVQLDAGLSGKPQFETANAAVTRIFFTDGGIGIGGGDLYEYNVEKDELVRMTTGADVVGSVIGASEDASKIYFVGNGALVSQAVAGSCGQGGIGAGDCNLYSMSYDGVRWEAPTLITVLSGRDESDWASEEGRAFPTLTARVSPNGRWLAFMSTNPLTGYDNRDAASAEPDAEVYEYDDATRSLSCASCNPTRSRPRGVPDRQIDTANGGLAGGHLVFSGWLAANLPGWTPGVGSGGAIYQSRYLSDSGRLYFNASDALAPKDTNRTEDVYEYEPEGVPAGEHACSGASASGSVTFKPARGARVEGRAVQESAGCVGLISSGESSNESAFLDATETGSEVFFLTGAKLAPQDIDTSYDVYDARECTTDSPCAPALTPVPPPCDNEASCKPAPTAQPDIFAPSGSATFLGSGNLVAPLAVPAPVAQHKSLTRAQKLALALKACKKQKHKKKRAACEKQARGKYGAKPKVSASNAGTHRRLGR